VLRFTGRGTNFAGWVLRSLGASAEGADLHQQALDGAASVGAPETRIAALEDLAEERLAAGDIDAAHRLLGQTQDLLHGDLVFGWRLRFKLQLLQARTALAREQPDLAVELSSALAREAGQLGVPRYAGVARLVEHQARAALGEQVDLHNAERDLADVRAAVALEAWWWTGESAATHGVPAWVDLAAQQVGDLAANAAERGEALLDAARPRLERWKAAAGR
jgi:hypothetical protein